MDAQPSRQNLKVNLLRFTFDSLYFCATPVETFRGETLVTAINQWYMPLIRTGWAVPLSFIVDVGTLLQRPAMGFTQRWKDQRNVRADVRELSLRYYHLLQKMRRQPIFSETVELIGNISEQPRRDAATKTFLRYLLAELGHFRNTYAFDTRQLKLVAIRPGPEGSRKIELKLNGKLQSGVVRFGDPTQSAIGNEFGTILELLRDLTDYYGKRPLNAFISAEKRLMIEVGARRPIGLHRLDYQFLHELLELADLDALEAPDPRPQLVDLVVPTDSYEVDGNVGGYIDVNRRRFSGSLAETLPSELALCRHPAVMYQKLLNEGALHFVRENIECIEEELRVLVCVVVDADDRMFGTPADLHETFSKGMSPYIRARSLAAGVLMDLARYFPRDKVRIDCGLYLWSAKARRTYRTEFDLFETWTPESAARRYDFVGQLAAVAPFLFDTRLGPEAERQNLAMDRDPGEYMVSRSRSRPYHCRHLIVVSSAASVDAAVPITDPRLSVGGPAGDSCFVVSSDVHRPTLGFTMPRTLSEGRDFSESRSGQLSIVQLRQRILETVILKGAGRHTRSGSIDDLGVLV